MNERDMIGHWVEARRHIILAQLGPIVLLTATVALLQFDLAESSLAVRIAAAGILLATGLLGAAAQIAAAREGEAVVADLTAAGASSAIARTIIAARPWIAIVKLVAPAIFVGIFLVLLTALFVPGAA